MSRRELRWDWIGPVAVAFVALLLRLKDLRRPNLLVFDETYYAKDAYSLLQHGYVREFTEDANTRITSGRLTELMTAEPSQIVHPDGGKWIIALGEQVFGMNSFGWRVSAAVVGALTVLVLARLVLRLTGSWWIGCLAGFLLCFDGLHFVMSRTALLDVFLAFWLVCAVACLVADRDWITARLDDGYRFFRPWQIGAGACFGMAMGTKWSGIWVLAAFGVAAVAWEVFARKSLRAFLPVAVPAFFTIVGVGLVVYLLTWTGWLLHADVYEQRFGRGYGDTLPWGSYVLKPTGGPFGGIIDAFHSLWKYHQMTYDFHTGDYLAGKTHPYASNPLGWLVMERPVAFDAQNDLTAASCGAAADSSCMREITAIGTLSVWWTGALATVIAIGGWAWTVGRRLVGPASRWTAVVLLAPFVLAIPSVLLAVLLHAIGPAWLALLPVALLGIAGVAAISLDRRWCIPILGVATTWLPWFQYDDRPIFSFYAVATIPFMIIATCLVVDAVRRWVSTARGRYGLGLGVGLLAVTTVSLFFYFYPIYTDQLISYDAWYSRMWFGSHWI